MVSCETEHTWNIVLYCVFLYWSYAIDCRCSFAYCCTDQCGTAIAMLPDPMPQDCVTTDHIDSRLRMRLHEVHQVLLSPLRLGGISTFDLRMLCDLAQCISVIVIKPFHQLLHTIQVRAGLNSVLTVKPPLQQ